MINRSEVDKSNGSECPSILFTSFNGRGKAQLRGRLVELGVGPLFVVIPLAHHLVLKGSIQCTWARDNGNSKSEPALFPAGASSSPGNTPREFGESPESRLMRPAGRTGNEAKKERCANSRGARQSDKLKIMWRVAGGVCGFKLRVAASR